ncbi:MAG: NCS2 family permease [Candidatus Adiutrix sp.]|jgi:AGZA family xanthine/uracil permease-like MFS transporter|nr:NCS2 family permease [Candidatus Adiutrix sp.]
MPENAAAAGSLEKLFKLSQKGTTVKTEMLAGLTTFVAVGYIIFVNPSILADAGIPKEAAIAATLWSTIFATALMGFWANYPVAVAPGMGLNAFFAYTAVLGFGLSWQAALAAVFVSGVVFLILTLGGIRQAIIRAVPMSIKSAIGVGIGTFIAFIGLQGSGIVIDNPATLVGAGHVASLNFELGGQAPLLTCAGVVFTGVLMARGVRGAILLGILFTTVLGMMVGAGPVPKGLSDIVSANVPSLFGENGTFGQLDFRGALNFGILHIIFTFTIVELFDNMGTLIGLTKKAGLMKADGHIENLDRALTTDAIGTMASAIVGTSTVTSYVESAAGVAEGGRTGLTAIVVAVLFFVALFFAPLVGLVQGFATAPALIIVGALMMSEVVHIDFSDITEAIPVCLTIVMMPLTYSIANGFAFGFVSYTLLKVCSGRFKDVSWVMYLVSAAFILNFVLRLH